MSLPYSTYNMPTDSKRIGKHKSAAEQARTNFKDLGANVQKFERKIKRTVKRLNIPIDAIMIKTCENIGNLKQKVATSVLCYSKPVSMMRSFTISVRISDQVGAVITFSSRMTAHPK